MIKNLIFFLFIIFIISACNDKPEVQPTYQNYLSVSPNPASDFAFIKVGNLNNEAFNLQVFNTKGEIILEEKGTGSNEYTIKITNENPGKFHMILKSDKIIATQELIMK